MRPIDGDLAKELARKLDTYAWTDFCSLIDSIPTIKNIPTDTPTRHTIHQRQTNADRIRAMTDEQLAAFISDQEFEAYDTAPGLAGEILDWLKEEAKDK